MDGSGTVRVKRKLRNSHGLLVLVLTEVIRYGADAPQVVRRLHGMLDELESTLSAERQPAIACQRSLLEAAVSAALPAPFAQWPRRQTGKAWAETRHEPGRAALIVIELAGWWRPGCVRPGRLRDSAMRRDTRA